MLIVIDEDKFAAAEYLDSQPKADVDGVVTRIRTENNLKSTSPTKLDTAEP